MPDRDAAPRLPLLDAVRGAALIAMVVFHAGWDVAWLGLAGSAGLPPGWQIFGNVVAAVFLTVSGCSLVLADRRRSGPGPAVRRLVLLGLTACGISLATWLAVPDLFIGFGILHCMVVADVLCLPLLRAPLIIPAAVAAALILAAWLPNGGLFDGVAWSWLGLSTIPPDTLDYRPLLPWGGFVPLGVVLARAMKPGSIALRWTSGPPKWFAVAGRHSLAVYLLHQAVLFPLVYGIALAAGVAPADPFRGDWRRGFDLQCEADCRKTSAAAQVCEAVCRCAADTIDRDTMGMTKSNAASSPATHDLKTIVGECFGATGASP